jgi:hypothetical protein
MSMDWLKGLVGPAAQFAAGQQGVPAWTPPYATPPQAGPSPGGGPPIGGMPPAVAPPPEATWTPAAASPAWAPAPVAGAAPGPPAEARIAALEARCAEMQRDTESIALFARTLLTVLEEKQVVTQEQFQDARRKLDLLDGKLDDRIGKLA